MDKDTTKTTFYQAAMILKKCLGHFTPTLHIQFQNCKNTV